MKKIIKLTESDLARIVRRVIKEQESGIAMGAVKPLGNDNPYAGLAMKVVGMLMTATGKMNTDEDMILDALRLIKDKKQYDAVISLLKKSPKVRTQYGENFSRIIDLISTAVTKTGYKDPYHKSDTEWFNRFSKYLQNFNYDESFTTKGSGGSNNEFNTAL